MLAQTIGSTSPKLPPPWACGMSFSVYRAIWDGRLEAIQQGRDIQRVPGRDQGVPEGGGIAAGPEGSPTAEGVRSPGAAITGPTGCSKGDDRA